MNTQQYQKIYDWFTARPPALGALRLAAKGLPVVIAGSYGLMLAGILLAGHGPLFWRAVLVPGVTFVAGTALRDGLNRPRPYEKGIVALLPKDTKGKSFPSRHSLAAGVLSATWLAVCPPVGAVMTVLALGVCISRVLAGVHAPVDVAVGFLLGYASGLVGMLVL